MNKIILNLVLDGAVISFTFRPHYPRKKQAKIPPRQAPDGP